MLFWIKIIFIVGLLVVVGGIYAKYQFVMAENVTLTANNKVLEQTVKDQDDTIKQQIKDANVLQQLLVKKAKNEKVLNDKINKLRSTISDLETKDPVVHAWASELIPSSVVDSLRNSGLSNFDQSGQAAGAPNIGFGNASPSGGSQVQPGLSRPSGQVPSGPAVVQQRQGVNR